LSVLLDRTSGRHSGTRLKCGRGLNPCVIIATSHFLSGANPGLKPSDRSPRTASRPVAPAYGPQLEAACRILGKLEVGQAAFTAAFDLPAKYVIHAVAPRYLDGTRNEAEMLRQTYVSICKIAQDLQITDMTLPSLGTGIYRFPLDLAAHIACKTLGEHMPSGCAATFVCFDKETLAAYELALGK